MALKKKFESYRTRQRLTTVREYLKLQRKLQQTHSKQGPNVKIIRIIVYER